MFTRLNLILFLTIFGATLAGSAAGAPAPCKGLDSDSTIVGQCRLLHGRVDFRDADGWFTFWPIGTKRLMSIQGSVPSNLDAVVRPNSISYVMGDFEVCPLSKDHPGVSQHICIARASRLVVIPAQHPEPPAASPR